MRSTDVASATSPDAEAHAGGRREPTFSFGLTLAALGVVFGDIGTSPLYTLKECTHSAHGVAATHDNILGVLSLILWSLTLVVTVKYLGFIMRADNHGEGGILALLALVPRRLEHTRRGGIGVVAVLVIAGAALLFGDGIITPAISVLSAVEGLGEEAPRLQPWVVPITCAILVVLFVIQRRGTGLVGALFGPVMGLWFLTMAGLGAWHIRQYPAVLGAVDPRHAFWFFVHNGERGGLVLGSVVLAVTGGEALYADMGHFGPKPIRAAWLMLVFPALLLVYFGQGAMLLANPQTSANPFFSMVPSGAAKYALVALATAATIIASQALISGAFSLTQQAIQLGYLPRMKITHTSRHAEGQIYIPDINWFLAIGCISLVLTFRESSKLAAAYGIAVTGTMAITSVVYFIVAVTTWKWPLWRAVPLLLLFLTLDIPFLVANAVKFKDGGFVPVLLALAFLGIMLVWRRGGRILARRLQEKSVPLPEFIASLGDKRPRPFRFFHQGHAEGVEHDAADLAPPGHASTRSVLEVRTRGTSVFMTAHSAGAPPMLVHHVERVRVLAENVVLCSVETAHEPYVPDARRVEVESLGHGFWRVVGTFGFMEAPDVLHLLACAKAKGLPCPLEDATFFLGRTTMLVQPGGEMREWEEGIFSFLSRNAHSATAYFGLPPEQVVEVGTQIDL